MTLKFYGIRSMLEATAYRKIRITSESPGSISLSFLMVFRQQRNNWSEKLGGQGKKWEGGANGEVPIRHLRKLRCGDIKELAKWHMVRKGFHSTCWPCGPGNSVGLHFRGEDSRNAVNSPKNLLRGWVQSVLWRCSATHITDRAPQYLKIHKGWCECEWWESMKLPLTQPVQKVCSFPITDDRQQNEPTASICRTGTGPALQRLTHHLQMCAWETHRERYSRLIIQQFTPTAVCITCQVSFPHQQGFVSPHSWSLSPFTFIKRMSRALTEWARLS